MKFSIIIPVYNVEKYLPECIKSILGQTFTDYEVVLIDDGSTDLSGSICDHYAHMNTKFHATHQKNQGQSVARNKGIEAARGEYILFLDSDDFYADSFSLERIARNADGCDVVVYDCMIYNKGNKREWVSERQTNNLSGFYKTGINYLQAALREKPLYRWYPCIYAFRREYWKKNEFRFQEGFFFEDLELVFQTLIPANNVCVVSKELYIYRKNRVDSTTGSVKAKSLIDKLKVVQSNITYVQGNERIPDDLKRLLCNNFAVSYCSVVEYLFFVPDKEKKEVVNEIKKAKWVGKYLNHPFFKILNKMISVLGIQFTSLIINSRKVFLRLA